MDIYILRHGKAEERLLTVKSDSGRKLTEAGKKDLRCISRALRNMDIRPDYIASSPLVRAKQTAEIALAHIKSKKHSIVFWDELKPESDVKTITKKLASLEPDASVLLVGHEPVLSDLISEMVSPGGGASLFLKKGGFAHVLCKAAGNTVSGTLGTLMAPKQLREMCK